MKKEGLAMQPLHIRWTFDRPMVVLTHPLHLDALLASARVREAREEDDPVSFQDDLPLESTGGVWKASMLKFCPASEPYLVPKIRKFDNHALALDRDVRFTSGINKFIGGSGKLKAYDMRFQKQWVEYAEAWCIGDIERVRALLSMISCIGPKASNNHGHIKECTVTIAKKEETELWRVRTLPFGSGLELEGIEYAKCSHPVKPPYWDRTNHVIAVMPV